MKKIIFIIIIFTFITISLIFPSLTLSGAKMGLLTWFYQILPMLLPFIILSNIVMKSNLISTDILIGKYSHIIPYACILFFGLSLGLPVGAILVTQFYKKNLIHRTQANILLPFCNMLSPFYIMNYVMAPIFDNIAPIYCLLWILYLPAILIPFFPYIRHNNIFKKSAKKTTSRFHLTFQIIDASIMNGFEIITKLGGYIILFGILAAFFKKLPFLNGFSLGITMSLLEITNGISILSQLHLPVKSALPLFIALVQFGGICTHFQTYMIISNTNLSKKYYTLNKLMLSVITYCIANIFLVLSTLFQY